MNKTSTFIVSLLFAQVMGERLVAEPVSNNGAPEKVSVLETPICSTHTTFYCEMVDPSQNSEDKEPIERKLLQISQLNEDSHRLQRLNQVKSETKDISPEGMDPAVFRFVKANTYPKPFPRSEDVPTEDESSSFA